MRNTVVGLAVGCMALLGGTASAQSYRTVWDDFHEAQFSVDTPTSKWFHLSIAGWSANDGIERTSWAGLDVVPKGKNPRNGLPAFTLTQSQTDIPGGDLDHPKWLVFMNHNASSGVPGFDANPGQVTSCETIMGGRTFNTEFNPFGNLVEHPFNDLRLAATSMVVQDFSSFMIFDYFVTNNVIYAFYERLPSARTATDNYASFSQAVPVALRVPFDMHDLKISYDRSAGTVTYYVDGREGLKVTKIGYRLPAQYTWIDRGGTEELVDMKQINCGMGYFTLLDGFRPSEIGLVKLASPPGYYVNPDHRSQPEPFFDEQSLPQNRLFGQGAEFRAWEAVISSEPAKKH